MSAAIIVIAIIAFHVMAFGRQKRLREEDDELREKDARYRRHRGRGDRAGQGML